MLKNSVGAIAVIAALTQPVSAQEPDGIEEGLDLFSEGARRLMQEFAGELAPLFLQLEALVDEITAYQAPEVLDNGDIIIRRRPDAPPWAPADPEAEDPIEL
ncbi:AAA+ family ATPase [Tropicimonas sp. S265A]|uniref:AAA+ family ATPase n=1 Tax=Tropicimonas sp. S265A TaxID=3415134 RepID=UPI003C7A292F